MLKINYFVFNIDLPSIAVIKEQLETAGYIAIGLGILELGIVLFTTYLLFKGNPPDLRGRSTLAMPAFAVAVAHPVHNVGGEVVTESIASEDFEVDMSTIGSRGKESIQRMSKCIAPLCKSND